MNDDVGYTIELIGGPADGRIEAVPELPTTYHVPLMAPIPIMTIETWGSWIREAVYERTLSVSDDGHHRYRHAADVEERIVAGHYPPRSS